MNNKLLRSVAIYALILMLFLYLLQAFTPKEYLEMDYNQFLGYIQTNSIKECVITDRKSVEGTLKDGTKFVTIVPEDPELYNMLVNSGATVKFQLPPEPSWLMTLAVNLLPVVILAGLFFYMIQQSQGGGNKLCSSDDPKPGFR